MACQRAWPISGGWQFYALYQGSYWDGEIEYPGSFNIQDDTQELQKLKMAKETATDPRVLTLIDHEIVELLGEDPLLVLPTQEYLPAEQLPAQEPFEPHYMTNTDTGETFIARTEAEHLAYAELGYVHKMEEY